MSSGQVNTHAAILVTPTQKSLPWYSPTGTTIFAPTASYNTMKCKTWRLIITYHEHLAFRLAPTSAPVCHRFRRDRLNSPWQTDGRTFFNTSMVSASNNFSPGEIPRSVNEHQLRELIAFDFDVDGIVINVSTQVRGWGNRTGIQS